MSHNALQLSAGQILGRAHKGISRLYTPVFSTLLVLAIIGAHLRLNIYGGGAIVVPAYLYLLAIAGFAVMHFNAVLTRVLPYTLSIWVLIFAMAGLKADGTDLMAVLNPTLQFTASISAAAILIIALNNAPPGMVRRTVTIIWLSIIILAILERIALREIFEQIKISLYSGSGRGVYSALARDMQIYGVSRATVMASEPSFLAYTLSILSILRFILDSNSNTTRRLSSLFVMFAVGYMVSPSISAIFFIASALIWSFWPRNSKKIIFAVLGFVITAIIIWTISDAASNYLPHSIRSHLESGSFFGRVLVGPSVGIRVLADYPLFGLGIGNEAGAYPIIMQEWASNGGFARFPWYYGLSAPNLMSNGFWWQWIYLGLFGGLIVILITLRLLTSIGVQSPFRALFCAWIVWYGGAAFVDPYSWLLVAVFALSSPLASNAVRPLKRNKAMDFRLITSRRAVGANERPA